MANYLPMNAISSVVLVSGEIGTPSQPWKGPRIPVVLNRQVAPSLDTGFIDDRYTRERNLKFSDIVGPPPDPPFLLPPPANLSLHIKLGEVLSDGRTGIIFECECWIPYGNENLGYKIPPMVVKLARRLRSEDLTIEAAVYEHLECIQGSAIPRCYGFFQARLLEYFDFGPMSILLLEKLGGLIELYKPLPNGAESDIRNACSDIAKRGIYHNDLRYSNMLTALSVEEGGLPSLPSPFTGKAYGWRIIDFDRAERTAKTTDRTFGYYASYLPRILNNIPRGCPVEPWE